MVCRSLGDFNEIPTPTESYTSIKGEVGVTGILNRCHKAFHTLCFHNSNTHSKSYSFADSDEVVVYQSEEEISFQDFIILRQKATAHWFEQHMTYMDS